MSDTPASMAARALFPLLDREAHTRGASPVGAAAIAALREQRLWGALTPRAVGGLELSLVDAMEVFAEVSRADGSTGWCLMAGASAIAYFAAYCPDEFTGELFARGVPLAAGQFAPNGVATREAGGYRVSGSYHFGSGVDYAEWVGAGFLVPPPAGSDAGAEYRFGLVPKQSVELQGNWDVLGLEGTASLDYRLEQVFVPEAATFLFAAPTLRRGPAYFRCGVIALTAVGHAGFALGVARRALDEWMEIARTKARMGASGFLKESEAFRLGLGRAESRLRACWAWLRESFAGLEAAIATSGDVDVPRINHARQATVFATQEAAEIVRSAYLSAGTTALRSGPLQRCFRDIHAASQHFFASPASTLDFSADLMRGVEERAIARG